MDHPPARGRRQGRDLRDRAVPLSVRLTHPEKELWPGVTKADYAAYLGAVADRMLPHVRDRPLSLQRFNAGVGGPGFFVKDAGRNAPDFVGVVDVTRQDGGTVRHAVANDARALQWLAQINVLTIHVAPVRRDRLDRPDRLVIDFDPSRDDDFAAVRAGARVAGELLREAGLDPWPMVTGSRGIHVVAPLRRTRDGASVRAWAEELAGEIAARDPKRLTTAFRKAKREGRIYVDVARNAPSQTAVAPYSPRAKPHAPVAMPVEWDRLDDRRLRPDEFLLRDVA